MAGFVNGRLPNATLKKKKKICSEQVILFRKTDETIMTVQRPKK